MDKDNRKARLIEQHWSNLHYPFCRRTAVSRSLYGQDFTTASLGTAAEGRKVIPEQFGARMPTKELLALFPMFDAIFTEGSISRAADRLCVTQSALSQALGRLRVLTGDELFQSTGRGMRPTPRAMSMIPKVREALTLAEAALKVEKFDLAKIARTFSLDIGGGLDAMFVPMFYAEFVKQAPGAKLRITCWRQADLTNELRTGEVELAVDFNVTATPGIRSVELFRSQMVVMVRRSHPLFESGISAEAFLRADHIALSWNRDVAASAFELELTRKGLKIKTAVTLPTLYALGALVEGSDLIATVSKVSALQLKKRFDVTWFELPIRLPEAQMHLMWHERFDEDVGHTWLRQLIKSSLSQATQASS